MVKIENGNKPTSDASSEEASTSKNKQKNQGKKRKRPLSESSNDAIILPDNALETERNVHASAVRNNLDETSVRKIIKRVVTNDHVLALVKLREEEEDSSTDDKKLQPKLTRAKVKELKKVSPACKSVAWDLENLELTPIKHIPVKTRPEVKALIAQELPEDEDDDEYEPTHDDVPSDDDHMESCSDLDSQPRTPATPASLHADSPRVLKDGPFKVPQEVSSARRKLDIEEEEATIALRTRSKLSLSSTSIEHIESTFVPPDDIPIQDVDSLWNQFLNECLNPASAAKNEDDDETDPEYNVAADPDAHDEDEEALGNSLIKISKKELNDLVTELFSILPETAEVDLAENLANSVLTDTSQAEISQWQGKQEPLSDADDENRETPSKRLTFEQKEYSRMESEETITHEMVDNGECENEKENVQSEKNNVPDERYVVSHMKITEKTPAPWFTICAKNRKIEISIEERDTPQASAAEVAPPSLRRSIKPVTQTVRIQVDSNVSMTPEQLQILQQQIRQHVQLATSNFMQMAVHPIHWKLAPTYKEYLVSLTKLVEKNENSIVNVCNLKPAYELITTWEKSVSEDTDENRRMIEFVQKEVDRSRRRIAGNSLYTGEFHEMFKKVVANSPVFLYPYLLPAMPYRPDATRRFCYLHSEDALIVLGLDQFWQYVESNPQLFKLYRKPIPRARRGLMATVELVTKHMFPWMTTRTLAGHIHAAKAAADEHNPIHRYFKYNELPKTQHTLLPFNPKITLYEQPEHEMPRIWVRYLAKTSKRFRNYLQKRPNAAGRQPDGVPIKTGLNLEAIVKKPLPIDFTKQIISHRATIIDKPDKPKLKDKFDINIQRVDAQDTNAQNNGNAAQNDENAAQNNENAAQNNENAAQNNENSAQNSTLVAKNFYRLVQTSTGSYLVPLLVNTLTVDGTLKTATTPSKVTSIVPNHLPETQQKNIDTEHCSCCKLLRKICKEKQALITDYFRGKSKAKICDCNIESYPRISNRLKLLVRNHKMMSELVYKELEKKLEGQGADVNTEVFDLNFKDMAYTLTYHLKIFTHASMSRRINVKKRVSNLLSRFNIDSDDPINLAVELFKVYGVELMDLYLDFLGFLTPEQVDKMEMFKDYFTRNCAKDLMDRIEEQVTDTEVRHEILTALKSVFTAGGASSCEICSGLLKTMEGYPTLARYTFQLFPHRKEIRTPTCSLGTAKSEQETQICSVGAARSEEQENAEDSLYEGPHNAVDYEADHSSCSEDSDAMSVDLEPPAEADRTIETDMAIKTEPSAENKVETSEAIISKIEVDEYYSDTSISIFEENGIKVEEKSDWKRGEDKIILQVLQAHVTREERKDESILDLLEEKNVYEMLSESLTEKSLSQIKERVIYLLTMLVLNENDN